MTTIMVFDIGVNYRGTNRVVHPVAVSEGSEIVLIDTGYPDNAVEMVEKMIDWGLKPEDLQAVIITHHNFDHIGSLAELKQRYPNMKILSSAEQAEFLEGKKPSMRAETFKRMASEGNEQQKEYARYMLSQLETVVPVKVDRIVEPGELLEICGGIRIVGTPGHMPGHISVYVEKLKTLITGDAMNVAEGKLSGANPVFSFDMEEAVNSIVKLKSLDIERIICYHGGALEQRGNEALDELIESFQNQPEEESV